MRISRVHLHGFGAFNKGLEVKFAQDRLNLVIGRNEAGKSTLMNGIFGILFGFRDLNLVRKYEPWDEHEAYAGELDLVLDDGRTFRITRDFKANTASIHEIVEGDPAPVFQGSADPRGSGDQDRTYFEHLGRLLGVQDEAVFRSTVFFGQQSLETSVTDQIRRLISGSSSVDYKGALHELHSRYAELTTENPWRSRSRGRRRLMEETRTGLEEDRKRLEEGRLQLARSTELERDLDRLREELATIEQLAESDREALAAHERLFQLLGRLEEAERRHKETLARRDAYRRYSDKAAEIESRIGRSFSHLRHAALDLAERVREHAAEKKEAERETDVLAHERAALAKLRPVPNRNGGFALGLGLLALAVVIGFTTPLGVPAGIILGLAVLPLGFVIGRNLKTGFKEAKASAERRVSDLTSSIAARKRRMEAILAEAGPALAGREPEEVLRELKEFQELREEKKRLLAAMKALGDREHMDQAFAEASRELGAVGAALEELRERSPSLAELGDRTAVGRHIETLRGRIAESDEKLAAARERLEQVRVELAGLGARMDFDLAELEENVRTKQERLERYDLERLALKESIDTLDQCIKDFQEGDVFRLSEEISAIFSKITGDKYTRVHLGAGLEPVISRGDRIPISPADLSQGARDQLYFAMRVAMARHLSKHTRLPLFLDDPFVNFDAERLAVTRDVLGSLDDHQLIMVTCDRDYEPWTDARIDLDQARDGARQAA